VVVKSGVVKPENLFFTTWSHNGLPKQMEKLFFTNSQNILLFTIKNRWIKEIGHNQWLQVSSKDRLILVM
jgi:hypothetical protein